MTSKKRKTKKRNPTPRQTRKFQLRLNHPEDIHVKEVLDFKRQGRAEVTTIRKGVTLFWALENGDLSVLFAMFPQYKSQFGAAAVEEFMRILSQQQAAPAGQGYAIAKSYALPKAVVVVDEQQISTAEAVSLFTGDFD